MPTGTVRGAVAICAVLLLAGCSQDAPRAGTLPSRSASPTTSSATPTLTPEQQVEATMREYFDATNRAFVSGDVSELERFSTGGCPCRSVSRDIEEVTTSGGRFEGLKYVVEEIRVHDLTASTALAEVRAKVPAYRVYNRAGQVTEDSNGGSLHTDFSLVWSDGRWIIGNALNLD